MENKNNYKQLMIDTSFADLVSTRDEAEKRFYSFCKEGVVRRNTESLSDFERRLLDVHRYEVIVIAANTEISNRLESIFNIIKNKYVDIPDK